MAVTGLRQVVSNVRSKEVIAGCACSIVHNNLAYCTGCVSLSHLHAYDAYPSRACGSFGADKSAWLPTCPTKPVSLQVVKALGELHAAGLVLEERRGRTLLDEFPEFGFETFFTDDPQHPNQTWHRASINLCVAIVPHLDKYRDLDKETQAKIQVRWLAERGKGEGGLFVTRKEDTVTRTLHCTGRAAVGADRGPDRDGPLAGGA